MFDLRLDGAGWGLGNAPIFLCLKNPRWRPNISRRKSERSLAKNTPALQASALLNRARPARASEVSHARKKWCASSLSRASYSRSHRAPATKATGNLVARS